MATEVNAINPRLLRRSFWPGGLGHSAYKRIKPALAAQAHAAFEAQLAALGPGDIALDLGANAGDFTKRMADTGAQVYSFEPDPDTFARLSAAVGARSNVTLHPHAISASAGTVTLLRALNYDDNPEAKSLGSSIARTSRFEMDRANSVDVTQVDLFAFIADLPQQPKLIKMDIEGAEWPIMERVMAGEHPFGALFVETHERFAPWRLMGTLNRLRHYADGRDAPIINPYWH